MADEKKCKKCGEIKPLTEFVRNRRCSDGYEGTCKACKQAAARARRQAKKRAPGQSTPEGGGPCRTPGKKAASPAPGDTGLKKDASAQYYDAGGIETIEIIKAKLTAEQFQGFLLGNIIKYACRLNFKGFAARDAEKADAYAAWLAKEMKEAPGRDRRAPNTGTIKQGGADEKEKTKTGICQDAQRAQL